MKSMAAQPASVVQARQLERILAVVERCLRREFPTDFHKRCAYAAFGVYALLRDAGADAELMGGDFLGFIVSTDNQRAAVAGFGFGEDQCSHFWVECAGRIIDVGPHYLPHEASYPVVRMPASAWNLEDPLPAYLRYRPRMRFPEPVEISPERAIKERCDRFIASCRERFAAQRGHLAFPTWVMTDSASVQRAASKGDKWALGAHRFDRMTTLDQLPF